MLTCKAIKGISIIITMEVVGTTMLYRTSEEVICREAVEQISEVLLN